MSNTIRHYIDIVEGLSAPPLAEQAGGRPVREFPLALQYIFTSLACRAFAKAMLSHPAGQGAEPVDIHRDASDDSYTHTALKLPSGLFLDTEGLRTFDELCGDFGIDSDTAEVRPRMPKLSNPAWEQKIRILADLCGWQAGAPMSRDIKTATHNWKAARAAFERLGGMAGSPEDMMDRLIATLSKAKMKGVPGAEPPPGSV